MNNKNQEIFFSSFNWYLNFGLFIWSLRGMKLKVGQGNLEASGVWLAQSKNQRKFPSIPR